jgi:ADP-heptose:LPS heptosyltransferase
VQGCRVCPAYAPAAGPPAAEPEPLHISFEHCPGDALAYLAAIESLAAAHPGAFAVAVSGTARELLDHHPAVVTPTPEALAGWRRVKAEYPAIDRSDARGIHFMQAACEHLAGVVGRPVPLAVAAPTVHLTAEEKGWMPQVEEVTGRKGPYWVVNAGHKPDFPAKHWGAHNWRALAAALRGRAVLVQVGEAGTGHTHDLIGEGVIDLRGKTSLRQLARLVFHAAGGVGPSSLLMHLCAALRRPYVLVAGGREPRAWQSYPLQTMFSAVGTLTCCREAACWKSGVGPEAAPGSRCERPVPGPGGAWVPECLERTRPEDVAAAVLAYAAR